MKNLRIACLLVIAGLMAAGPGAAATKIKLGTLAPEGSPWHEIMLDLAMAWKKASDGALRVRIYPGGAAGDEADMVRKIRVGQLQAAALTSEGLAEIAHEVRALQMPMMYASDSELNYVRDRIAGKLEAILEAKGFKVLTWGDAGWVHYFTKRPAVDPEDLRPMKIFTWAGDGAVADAYKAAGFHPVPLAATEIHTGLQSGLIDAVPTTPVAALSFQWFGLANHMTDLKWAPLIGAIVISARTWRAIRPEVKPRLIAAARATGKRMQAEIRRFGGKAVEVMKQHGLTVHSVPKEAVARWERIARRSYPRLIGRYVPAAMFEEVERLRNDYRRLHNGP